MAMYGEILNDSYDSTNSGIKNVDQTAPLYEDGVAGKAVVEERYSITRCTADTTVLSGAGYIKGIQVERTSTTAVTAGLLTIYDNTAGSGTKIWEGWITARTEFIPLLREVTTGIRVEYDGTLANVAVHVLYR